MCIWWVLSGEGPLNLSLASPLKFSLNFGLLRIQLSALHFFLSSHLILFFVFGTLLGGGKARIGGGASQVWSCGEGGGLLA